MKKRNIAQEGRDWGKMAEQLWFLCEDLVREKAEKKFSWFPERPQSEEEVDHKTWKQRCQDGHAGSSRCPSSETRTPEQKFAYHDVVETPSAVPMPFKKVEIQAQHRLQRCSEAVLASHGQPQKAPRPSTNPSVQKVEAVERGDDRVQPREGPKSPEPQRAQKKPRKQSDGPMQKAYAEFLVKQKANGMKHIEAMRAWRNSSERKEVMEKLSSPEIRRRRYNAVDPIPNPDPQE